MQQQPRQPPTGSAPVRRKRNTGLKVAGIGCGAILLVLAATAVLGEVVGGHKSATPAKAAYPPVAENLVFSGQVKGTLTQGLNPHGISNKDPNPPPAFGPFNATQCTFSDTGWEADILGDVRGTKISLRLTIDSRLPAAGTKDLDNRANSGPMIALIGADGRYNKDTFEITGTNLNLQYSVVGSASLTVNPDKRAGSMKIDLTDAPHGTNALETIHGSWRCA